ncbi:MAG: sulfite exporter TauE/SafE family protein [Proteobacteria bacterium]|nr:sulfite exporter TauE/SafE family protein [Pseudomonadota bacterium]
MSYLIICTSAVLVSGLTLFSGFGLGTILMPVFALFFPVKVAVAATAIVHLANNIFKAALLGHHADFRMVVKFALPAAMAAVLGATMLNFFSGLAPILEYEIGTRLCSITWVKTIVAALIIVFSLVEVSSKFDDLSFDTKYIPLGGVISGFLGGLSGHQGALRTAFLIRAGLPKERFVGTMILSAIVVDISRVGVYGLTFYLSDFELMQAQGSLGLVAAGSAAAFTGAFIGTRMLKKITMGTLQKIVGILLIVLALAMGTGLI